SRAARHGAFALLLCALASSCDREPVARVVTAVFQDDKIADGNVDPDETIVLALDRPLAPEFRTERVHVRHEPATSPWGHDVKVSADRRSLEIVVFGRPDFRLDGVFGSDDDATGLLIDLGDGVEQRVDLLRRSSVPRLIRAWWEDAHNPIRNGAIDEGDRIHLVFDEPVELAPDVDGQRVHVPHHVLLSQDGMDRLDDGERASEWTAGEDPNEVVIVLGSRPFLRLAPHESADAKGSWSAIAANGTLLRPLPLVRARAGGLGVASQGEVPIERPMDSASPEPRFDESFPSPGGRKLHTVTPLADRFVAVIAGGEATATGEILADVLVYSLFAGGFPGRWRWVGRERWPRPVVEHTATCVAGGDRSRDGFVLIAGGRDGVGPSGDLTVIRLGGESESPVVVEKLETSLLVPRWGHRAVAVGGDRVVIDGGFARDPNGEQALVGATEIIELEGAEEGDRDRERRVRVRSRRVVHNLPREGHSLTVLGGEKASPWVLAYGGHGYSPERWRLLRGVAIGSDVSEAS